ncbi:unnamed protein product [Discosporangium mesarthrocarpum]
MRDGARIYLRPVGEVPTPPRSPSERFISNIMFLVAADRPRELSNEAWLMAGLASGQSPRLSPQSAAARTELLVTWKSNRHHRRGTVKADGDKESHPSYQGKDARSIYTHIWVQKDRTKSHARNWVIAAIEAVAAGNIILETQPPNSPGLNVLDVGFFNSIQRLKDDFGTKNSILVKLRVKIRNESGESI